MQQQRCTQSDIINNTHQSVQPRINRSIDQSINRSINQPTEQPTNHPTNQSINQSTLLMVMKMKTTMAVHTAAGHLLRSRVASLLPLNHCFSNVNYSSVSKFTIKIHITCMLYSQTNCHKWLGMLNSFCSKFKVCKNLNFIRTSF